MTNGLQQKVVVHYADGTIIKGFSIDFGPAKERFHLQEKDSGEQLEVHLSELKGVFFVETFEGQSGRRRRQDIERVGLGRHIGVKFKDGETIVGYTNGYSPDRLGFFLIPADGETNNTRIFVINAHTESVDFL